MISFSAAVMLCSVACAATAVLCRALRPLLLRYALARPNARSSHKTPTPQGGGIAVLLGTVTALAVLVTMGGMAHPAVMTLLVLSLTALSLGIVGAWDDIRPLPALTRLMLQTAAVLVLVIYAAPDIRLFGAGMPLVVERLLVVLAGVWFVNLTNFMDGLDWITVAAIVPPALALAGLGTAGYLDEASTGMAYALAGAMLGFAPFNRPVARLFLGDVGALPLGLLLAYLLYRFAGSGAFIPAVLLPLYSVSDASLTLARRLLKKERVWEAHRSHFYQQATDNGFSTLSVSLHVFALNVLLAALSVLATVNSGLGLQCLALLMGVVLTALLLHRFSTSRSVIARSS